MPNEELIINEGANSEKVPIHYEVFVYEKGTLKRLGGVYSKIVDNHYALFSYSGYRDKFSAICKQLIGIRDLNTDKKELSDILVESAELIWDNLLNHKKEIESIVRENSRNIDKGNILDIL